jgi:hypothetical protein
METDCLSCFGTRKIPFTFIYTDYDVIDIEQDIIQYCILCEKELTNKLVYCKHCQCTIGHLFCVKKWLYKNNNCPYCKKETKPIL